MKKMFAAVLLSSIVACSIALADSLNVRTIGVYGTPGRNQAVAVSGSYAYVTANNNLFSNSGLHIVNISDPSSPSLTGVLSSLGSFFDVALSGGRAYVTGYENEDYYGLRIIDVSDPAHPAQLCLYKTPHYAEGIAVKDTFAYVAASDSGLRIINVSNPAAPVEKSHYVTPGTAYDVSLSSIYPYAYVAAGYQGVRIISGIPAGPFEAGFYDTPGNALGVASSGNYIYVADENSGLRILDLSGGLHEVGHYDIPALGVVVSGNYAYVAASTSGLRIIDISNPASPIEAGFYDTPGSVYAVALSGSLVYVADGDSGLRILQFPIPPVMQLNTGQHDFGTVTAGDSLSWNGLYIKNTGSLPFSVDSLKFATGSFRADAPMDSTLAPGDSLQVTLWFKPGASGQFTDIITVYSDEAENSPVTAGLTGTGVNIVEVINVPWGTVPRFEGTIDPAEWADAYCDTFRLLHKSKAFIPDSFWVKYNQDTLYLVLKTPSYSSFNIVFHYLLFDTLMNRTELLENDDLRLSVFYTGEPVEWYGHENWGLAPVSLWRSGYSANTDLITEFVVPLNKIGITPESFDSVGFSVFADGADHFGCWPSSADSIQPRTWGILTSNGAWTGMAGRPTILPTMKVGALANAFPNPASTHVTLQYQLPAPSKVKLSVYNIAGQLVKRYDRGQQSAGSYSVRYDTGALPNGLYFYQLDAGSYKATRRMLVIK